MNEHGAGVGTPFDPPPPMFYQGVSRNGNYEKPILAESALQHALSELEDFFVKLMHKDERRNMKLDDICIVPSTSASFTSQRNQGGFSNDILKLLEDPNWTWNDRPSFDRKYDLPPGLNVPHPRWALECNENLTFTTPTIPPTWYSSHFDENGTLKSQIFSEDVKLEELNLEGTLQDGLSAIAYCARTLRNERINARISAIKEPCKARIVSCGDSPRYIDAYRWDRLLRRFIQRDSNRFFPLYRKIGAADFHRTYVEARTFWQNRGYDPDELEFVSGDYSAATDGLDPKFSVNILNTLVYSMLEETDRSDIFQNLKMSLVGHNMCYIGMGPRDEKGEKTDLYIPQLRGQLMGSPVSFPILCFINFLVNWVFIDPYLATPIKDVPILVNGDDLFMVLPRSYYEGKNRWYSSCDGSPGQKGVSWTNFIKVVGFSESLGKNYIHPHTFCMNSQFYTFRNNAVHYIDYVRLNLIMGGGRVAKTCTGHARYELSLQEKFRLFQKTKRDYINDWVYDFRTPFSTWKKLNKEQLQKFENYLTLSYNLPTVVGGMGVIRDFSTLSDYDKRFAHWILRTNQGFSTLFNGTRFQWESSIVPSLEKEIYKNAGYEKRWSTDIEQIFGSDLQVPDMTSRFLDSLNLPIGVRHHEDNIDGIAYKQGWSKREFIRKEKLMQECTINTPMGPFFDDTLFEFREFARKIRKFRDRFHQLSRSEPPITEEDYNKLWDYAPSFSFFPSEVTEYTTTVNYDSITNYDGIDSLELW